MSTTCTECGRENRADARFCDECGSVLATSCDGCGRTLRTGARFCDGCGREVSAEADEGASPPDPKRDPRSYTPGHLADRILNQKAALIGERKHVTVLFADVAGYTGLAERSDPEAMHTLMDRCFKIALDHVHGFEGTINQFTGDGFMALFGAPLALEDAPRRGVLAALAIQRALAPLDAEVQQRHQLPFRMRIGVHCGPVVVGSIGDDLRMDYTAVGDTTNLAARLQQVAGPGSVWISEAVRSRVTGFFDLRDLGTLDVKGKRAAIQAWEVLGERSLNDPIAAASDAGLTPLVGRSHELASLRTAFESAGDGRGQVAMLVGEAGIGKSRLVYEFRRSLGDEAHTWVEGRCSPFATTTAFQAVADGVRRSFAIDDRDDEAKASEKLEQSIALLGEDLAWTVPFIRHLLALPTVDESFAEMDAMERRSGTYRALQSCLLRRAESEPLVVVVEDLHWIDAASEEFLAFLSEAIPAARLFLIVTYRPGYEHAFGDRSYHLRLALQALSAPDMSAMAGSLVVGADALPPELLELITSKAEGNPLFVEEVTKSLIEEGVLHLEDGSASLSGDAGEISVPDRIQDVLMARLDRLPEEPRVAIQVASVIGREFALRLLAQIREAGDRVQDVIGELRALELIYEKTAHPELAFMFKHALTHDVAYDSILHTRRRSLHRIVGSAIEELYADRLAEHYEALAHHFERAEEWERALNYHERAAERAANAFANQSVVEHCEAGLAIIDRLDEASHRSRRIALLERVGAANHMLSDFAASAEAHLGAAEYPEARARNLAMAAVSLVWSHDYEACLQAATGAVEIARETGDNKTLAIANVATDLLENATKGPGTRLDMGDHAVELADASGDPEAIALAFGQRTLFLEQFGLYSEAISLAESAQERTRDAKLGVLMVHLYWALGMALTCVGAYDRARAILEGALDVCNRCGDRAFKARLLNTLGWWHGELHDYGRAREYNEQGEILASEMVRLELVEGAPELHANAAVNLANNFTATGDPARARNLLLPLAEELAQPGDPWQRWRYAPHVYDALARVELAEGDPEAALVQIERELAGAREHSCFKLEARALELRGRALLTQDRRDDSEAALRASIAVSDRIGYQPTLWRADSLLAELARRRGDAADARRRAEAVSQRLAGVGEALSDSGIRRGLSDLVAALSEDPLDAYR